MNKIWNVVYILWIRSFNYSNNISKSLWKQIDIERYEIIKETPKYYFLKKDEYNTFCYWKKEHKFIHYSHMDLKRYKKDNVEIEWIMTKKDLFKKLDEVMKQINENDDISNNDKKECKKSYDEYIKNKDKF